VIAMDNSNTLGHSHPDEINLSVHDSEVLYCGGSQYWFAKKAHQLSGCGPVAAANITAYLAKTFPDKYGNLYPYKDVFNRYDFTEHMTEIRKFVKPGIFGLTCVHKFSDGVLSFSRSKGVTLIPHVLDKNSASMDEAVDFMSTALGQKLPVAILILKHPVKEFEDYAWHWMTITRLRLNLDNNKYYISVSTYGEYHEIDLDLLWNSRGPKHLIRLAYFN
jgi:hypothetical protein